MNQQPDEIFKQDDNEIHRALIKTWLEQDNYPFDSLNYSSEIVFSNGFGPFGFMNLKAIPKAILRDSVLIKADSVKINNYFHSKYKFDPTKNKIQFYFSNFMFDSLKINAMANLSIFFLNKTEDRIVGGEEKTVIYKKEANLWTVKKEISYMDY